jgi:hypothetical protein
MIVLKCMFCHFHFYSVGFLQRDRIAASCFEKQEIKKQDVSNLLFCRYVI